MTIGPKWSVGNAREYQRLADLYNRASREQLKDFLDALDEGWDDEDDEGDQEDVPLHLHAAQEHLVPPEDRDKYRKLNKIVVENWYGEDGAPMWERTAHSRPREIYEVNLAARRYLAELRLADPRRTIEIYGQCDHPEFEIRISWSSDFGADPTIRVYVYTPNNYVYEGRGASPTLDLEIGTELSKSDLIAESLRAGDEPSSDADDTTTKLALDAATRTVRDPNDSALIRRAVRAAVRAVADEVAEGVTNASSVREAAIRAAIKAASQRAATASEETSADEGSASNAPDDADRERLFDAVRRAAIEADVLFEANQLKEAVAKRNRVFDDPRAGAANMAAASIVVDEAEARLRGALGQREGRNPDFKGTSLAVADDRDIPLIGGLEMSDLRELFPDPRQRREPLLSQPPNERNQPRGRPVDGVRFRWNRRLNPGAPGAAPYNDYVQWVEDRESSAS